MRLPGWCAALPGQRVFSPRLPLLPSFSPPSGAAGVFGSPTASIAALPPAMAAVIRLALLGLALDCLTTVLACGRARCSFKLWRTATSSSATRAPSCKRWRSPAASRVSASPAHHGAERCPDEAPEGQLPLAYVQLVPAAVSSSFLSSHDAAAQDRRCLVRQRRYAALAEDARALGELIRIFLFQCPKSGVRDHFYDMPRRYLPRDRGYCFLFRVQPQRLRMAAL